MNLTRLVVVIFVSAFAVLSFTEAGAAGATGQVLMGQHALAAKSRILLAKELYRRGSEMESSGDFAGAFRLWTNAHNLDPGNEAVVRALAEIEKLLLRVSNEKYRSILFDIQYGRNLKAKSDLERLRGMMDGINPQTEKKIDMTMNEIERLEDM